MLLADDRGRRLSDAVPDALCVLAGEPLVVRTARFLLNHPAVEDLVVFAPRDTVGAVRHVLAELTPLPLVLADPGGPHRALHQSIRELRHCDILVVHDVRHPMAGPAVLDRVIDSVAAGAPQATAVVEITETVKQVGRAGRVLATIGRDSLRQVQAPVAARYDALVEAHRGCDPGAPLRLAALVGSPGATVPGDPGAVVLNHPGDLKVAAAHQ